MTDDRIWDDPAWLVAEVRRLQRTLRGYRETNLWRNKQLDDIGELVCAWDEAKPSDVDPYSAGALNQIGEVLRRPRPEHIGPPEAMRVAFNWRDPRRPDGYRDALPGDGFGFCDYVENETRTGLMMQFECAGILACVDMPVEMLRNTLAEAGFSIWPMVCKATELITDPLVRDMQTRITELERDLKSTEAENERLMARAYGEGDGRDHVQIAVDRAAELRVGDTVRVEPTIEPVHRPSGHEPPPVIALRLYLPLPGYPGHHGAVHEMLQAFKVWGINLQRPKCMHPFEEDCAACRPDHEAIRQADEASEYWKEKG